MSPAKTDAYGDLVSFAWETHGHTEAVGAVLILDGLAHTVDSPRTDPYVLELSYDASAVDDESLLRLMAFDPLAEAWKTAVSDYADAASLWIDGAWDGRLTPGLHGLDPVTDTVWAVLDGQSFGSRFVVVAVAELTSFLLLAVLTPIVVRPRP
ncbi:MAG: hypothetical protein AAF593_01895 [Planctomycetota bacterium]